MKKTEHKRFEIVFKASAGLGGIKILKDTVTGVLYLWHSEGYAGGLTVMLDQDGHALVQEKE